jgi:hypothetical protein
MMMMLMMVRVGDLWDKRTDVCVETVAEIHMSKELSFLNASYNSRRERRCTE